MDSGKEIRKTKSFKQEVRKLNQLISRSNREVRTASRIAEKLKLIQWGRVEQLTGVRDSEFALFLYGLKKLNLEQLKAVHSYLIVRQTQQLQFNMELPKGATQGALS